MARYTTTLSNRDAEGLASLLHSSDMGHLDTHPAVHATDVTVQLTEAQVRWLENLDSDHDGHVDNDGAMWIDGTDYPLALVHNA